MKYLSRLFKAFANLPKEVKLILSLCGVGSFASIFYLFRTKLLTSKHTLVLVCVLAGSAVLIFLIVRLFSWSGRRRTTRMSYELSSGGAAGSSMDVSAKIKANNEKFFKAVKELKKNVGISVYELPWYIVIGDSGCGKTKLVNEGGLTFSTGKPEGYQLGTLDYNWWFSEDAIFIDMAGRLCNPQDDRDRKEWMAFLDTIAKGRRGYPINGALVCVSAEHLLQDPAEKHESDAIVALERLRDLQTKLGVTFATYLIVTKCDKMLGFMQFFDRAEHDITIKNQVFGWSKPGGFEEHYDPENFKADFGKVYRRLNDLRLRRLNDDSEELDLGLAYAFPEEFRRLADPLQTYVRTLFPMLKHARVAKNLIFRGVYFTSATQEGELILKHLAERLGNAAASQFPPLDDFYPHKRPHFIKDVLMRKVFPEHGLVFRNEQQVVRNRRLNKTLLIGTGVLGVLLFAAFAFGVRGFKKIVEKPKQWAVSNQESFAIGAAPLDEAFKGKTHAKNLEDHPRVARLVCGLCPDPIEPVQYIQKIRMALVESAIRSELTRVGNELQSGAGLNRAEGAGEKNYLDSFEEYVRWSSCANAVGSGTGINQESFQKLLKIIPDSPLAHHDEITWYFRTAIAAEFRTRGNPAELLGEDSRVSATINTVLKQVRDFFVSNHATIQDRHRIPAVQQWLRIRNECQGSVDAYSSLLKACSARADPAAVQEQFANQFKSLEAAVSEARWKGDSAVQSLADGLWSARLEWANYKARLESAHCGAPIQMENFRIQDLDTALWSSAEKLGWADAPYKEELFSSKEAFSARIKEPWKASPCLGVVALHAPEGQGPSALTTHPNAETVINKVLRPLALSWAQADLDRGEDKPCKTTLAEIQSQAEKYKRKSKGEAEVEPIKLSEPSHPWDIQKLTQLRDACNGLRDQTEAAALLQKAAARLKLAADEDIWGFASLQTFDDRTGLVDSSFAILKPKTAGECDKPAPKSDGVLPVRPDADKAQAEEPPSLFKRETKETKAPQPAPRHFEHDKQIPRSALAEFLNQQAEQMFNTLLALKRVESVAGVTAKPAVEALEESARAYFSQYFKQWQQAYQEKCLSKLDDLMLASSWDELAGKCGGVQSRDAVNEFRESFEEILRTVRYSDFDDDGSPWATGGDAGTIHDWFSSTRRDVQVWKAGDWAQRNPALPRLEKNQIPWRYVSADVAGQFNTLLREIGNTVEKGSLKKGDQLPSIAWNAIEDRKREYELDEELLVKRLLDFVSHAQNLLDVRLMELVVNKQNDRWKNQISLKGWPFLDGKEPKDAMNVVERKEFEEFLKEIKGIQQNYSKLESSLPSLPGKTKRSELYGLCDEWLEFLAADKGLTMTVSQPARKNDPTDCQVVGAVAVKVQLGSVLKEFPCESQHYVNQEKIPWPSGDAGKTEWTISIDNYGQGRPNPGYVLPENRTKVLGTHSALAMAAYLENYGRPSSDEGRKAWTVDHNFPIETGKQKKEYGVRIRYHFDKRLPDPIRKLDTVPPPKWKDCEGAGFQSSH